MAQRWYLLIHTMTIADYDVVVQAQFFHTVCEGLAQARLIGRRVCMRLQPSMRKRKASLVPTLKGVVKRGSAVVKHHLRTVNIDPVERPQNGHNGLVRVQSIEEKEDSSSGDSQGEEPVYNEKLTQYSSSNDTAHWLTVNRFGQYLEMFARFSGADMMRLSRDELVQICGRADGIRLHNAMHMRAIAPLLRFYVRRENQTVFNAIFLTSYNHVELLQKLSTLAGLNPSQIKAIYIEGPQAIHIQLNDEMLRHLEDETRFSLNVIPEDGSYVLLLKKRVE